MKNKIIAIYYIATGDYKKLFHEFLESLQNFFPNNQKIVKLLSDGLEEYRNYVKGNVSVELCPRINNYPWPIIALYKMWHIMENYDKNADYICYFNSNAIVYPHNENVFDLNKLSASLHSFNAKNQKYDVWKYINIYECSSAYLENDTYDYVQSGFFFGPSELVYNMCEDVVELIKSDMRMYLFAQWHDESYFNKWCVDHEYLVDKKQIMTIYNDDIDRSRFIFLREKREYEIEKEKL